MHVLLHSSCRCVDACTTSSLHRTDIIHLDPATWRLLCPHKWSGIPATCAQEWALEKQAHSFGEVCLVSAPDPQLARVEPPVTEQMQDMKVLLHFSFPKCCRPCYHFGVL